MAAVDLGQGLAGERQAGELVEREEARRAGRRRGRGCSRRHRRRSPAICASSGAGCGQIDDRAPAGGSRPAAAARRERAVVLDHPFQRLEREVEPVERGVAPLEPGDDAEASAGCGRSRRMPASAASSAASPAWPNGLWPRSWASATASARSSSSSSARASVRAICATSRRVGQPRAEMVALEVGEDLGLVLRAGGRPCSGRCGRGRAGRASATGSRLGHDTAAAGLRAGRRTAARLMRHAGTVGLASGNGCTGLTRVGRRLHRMGPR